MNKSLGWQLDGIQLPSAHTFVLDKFSDDFIKRRKDELIEYWKAITDIPQVTDFHKHHCSEVLKCFLDVEDILKSDSGEQVLSEDEDTVGGSGGGGAPERGRIKKC